MKRQWCIGQINAEYVCRLETLLLLYALATDEQYPLVCFDERPCFLIGNVVEGLAPQAGQVAKEHYATANMGRV